MLAAARGALEGLTDPPELLAVSVLTSMDRRQLEATGVERDPATQAELLVRIGMDAGFAGSCARRKKRPHCARSLGRKACW